MIHVKQWLCIFLLIYTRSEMVLSLDKLDTFCGDWINADEFCKNILNNSTCNNGQCVCGAGYQEIDDKCVKDDNFWTRKNVDTEYIFTEETDENVYEMSQMNHESETDQYLARFRREDAVIEGTGMGPETAFLFASGDQEGDSRLAGTDDGCVKIKLDVKVPFRGKKFRKIYVCANGIICFKKPYHNPTPPRNNVTEDYLRNRYCICPFHMDIDVTSSGDIYYQGYDLASVSDTHPNVVMARQLVNNIYNLDFSDMLYMLVVTWWIVPRSGGLSSERVSFQGTYVTNGRKAYAFFDYGNMAFLSGCPFIGIFIDGTAEGLDNNADCSFLRRADLNVNFGNYEGFTTFDLSDQESSYEAECKLWYKSEKSSRSFYRAVLNAMPDCPCSLWELRWDGRFFVVSFDVTTGVVTAALWSFRFFPYGKTCTYTWFGGFGFFGAFIGWGSNVGTFNAYNQLIYPNLHEYHDLYFKDVCCSKTNLCRLYYKVRPRVQRCRWFRWFWGWGWGDPHFLTLDNRNYTFNGYGEYLLVQHINTTDSTDSKFQIQTRTELALNEDGTFTDATIFSGFAIQTGSDWVQVELNDNKTGIKLYAGSNNTNWAEYTQDFDQNALSYTEGGLILSRENDTVVAKFTIGLQFQVTQSNGVLQYGISLRDEFQGQTIGLLGNFNNDTADDLIPRGTSSPLESPDESEIFNFGQTWITSAEESIFKYFSEKSHADYSFPNFQPKFTADLNQTLVAEAPGVCGADNTQCIYDYAVTGNKALAEDSNLAIEKADETEAIAINAVPVLNITSGSTEIDDENYVYVNVNENKTIGLIAEDDGTLTFELFNTTANVAIGTSANDGSFEIYLTVENTDPVSLCLVAKDNLGAYSPILEFVIVLCTGCNSHGVCDNNVIREDTRETDYFKYATCNCEAYWDGDDCEDDYDGCVGAPCAGRTCIDTPADQNKANPSLDAFSCGPCPTGYEEDGFKCIDTNECTNTSTCDQTCENTEGSYFCQCNSGYRLAENGRDCMDINECEESTSGCEQICTNTDGSFDCSCFTGFTYNEATPACEKDSVPPSGCDLLDCSQAEGCTLNESSQAVCFCNAGYKLLANNTCTNIDECNASPCAQICNDNEGSFTCSCYAGFKLQADQTSCEPCEFPNFGENCADVCGCTQGSTCDSVHGCICKDGWNGTNCDIDVDECEDLNICEDSNRECVNSVGSYTCDCRSGYQLENETCVDVDECSDVALNTCEKNCTNTEGGFSCSCPEAYIIDPANDTRCIDFDECDAKVSECDQVCVNSVGRYSCDCKAGYNLNADRRTCSEVILDHCANFTDVSCTQICSVVNGAPQCSCKIGYNLGADNQSCIDVDECDPALNLNMCSENDTCVNFKGGYSCSCSPGFKLENDQRTCKACDSEHFGESCANECACGVGATRCDSKTGCVCEEGWIGEKCSIDKNECANFPCTGENEECTNTLGSYSCTCKKGYTLDNNVCKDVDECTDTPEVCSQTCENNPGSYTCSCKPGFLQDGANCNDIDECQGQHECSQICANNIGNYRCTCNEGYHLDLTDRTTCIPDNACDPSPCGLNTECAVVNNVATCSCKAGFKFVSGSTTTCEDIAECDGDPNPCSQQCSETSGGYECSCNLGYKLDADLSTCSVCTKFKYGDNCTQDCTCNTTNTLSCNNVNGTCNCNDGWSGDTCDTDVNECEDLAVHNCTANSQCVDTQGSFVCKCDAGYFKSGDGTCQVCGEGTFGVDCASDCTCVAGNIDTCNAVDGSCVCQAGWEGLTCSQNIDECTENTFTCPDNSTCEDTDGSYRCNCDAGFIKTINMTCEVCEQGLFGVNCNDVCSCVSGNTELCNTVNGSCTCKAGWEGNTCSQNIDECTQNTFTCPEKSTCQDTDGSYVCNCDTGYTKTNDGKCEDTDECTTGSHNCTQKCTNTIGSFNCSCDVGYSGTGNDCTQCVNSWGVQCVNPCICDLEQSSRCDPVTGCVCISGWEGTECTEDIDECATDPNACGLNEFCNNTEGNYTCACNTGYIKETNVCQECSNNTYGVNCGTSCNCVRSNTVNPTQSCDHINGTCYCTPFWEGARCETDVHECLRNTDNCTRENEGCHNTEGGFNCSCLLGYTRDSNDNCVLAMVIVRVVLTIDIILNNDLLVSLTHTLYVAEFKSKLEIFYGRKLGNVEFYISINSITNGSVIADYNVIVFEPSVPDVAIANAILARNQESIEIFNTTGPVTGMIVQNTTVPVTTGNVTDELVCEAYEASIHFCDAGYACLVKNDKPLCEPVEEDNFPLIFGLGFGIPMFLLCAAAVLIFAGYWRYRRNRLRTKREISDDRSSSLFGHRLPVRMVTGVPGPLHPAPDLQAYEPSEYSSSDFSDNHRRYDDAASEDDRYSQSTWNFLFHNTLGTEKFQIRRPKVDLEPRGHHASDNFY
ncbi:uncharacterized protein LOC123559399 isoform X2 [Mercenaria mercenaria]|uniref:uncharacterized protein LOC123559399 isoform X2 n=1 Tax=Mercenaria mercenaria TaxID=6596 RepID=UPI00234E7C3A|nr:uncharacterized protein LOC123559399 isoform X2 [Mercenaria mercenaria]